MTGRTARPWTVAAIGLAALFAGPGAAAEDAPDVAALVARLGSAETTDRDAAGDALVAVGGRAVPALVAALADPRVRAAAAHVLGRFGPDARDAVPALTAIAVEPWSDARRSAVRALGAIGAPAEGATPALAKILSSADAKDRADAAFAAHRILVDVGRRTPPRRERDARDTAIVTGCDWLVRHQGADGAWRAAAFSGRCPTPCDGPGDERHDLGVTGLATLALLGAPEDAERTKSIDAALAFLARAQHASGRLSLLDPEEAAREDDAYDHACAALALVDAYVRRGDERLRGPAQRAVDHVLARQNPAFGWRYGVADGENDTSVTAWMCHVLDRARTGALAIDGGRDPAPLQGGLRWVEKMTDAKTARVGYQQQGGPSSRTIEDAKLFPPDDTDALTACGLLVREMAAEPGEPERPRAAAAARLLKRLPRWDAASGTLDVYYWLHGTLALRRRGGAPFVAWRPALLRTLTASQARDGTKCTVGSWPAKDPWGARGGRVYTTAAAVLALEACEDPNRLPPFPPAHRTVADALGKAAFDADPALARKARAALRALHATFLF